MTRLRTWLAILPIVMAVGCGNCNPPPDDGGDGDVMDDGGDGAVAGDGGDAGDAGDAGDGGDAGDAGHDAGTPPFDGGTPPTCYDQQTTFEVQEPNSPSYCTMSDGTSLTTTVAMSSAVIANGYAYVIGGITDTGGSASTTAVQCSALDGDGMPGAWTTATSIPGAGYALTSAVASDGRLYVLGGTFAPSSGTTPSNHVYVVDQNAVDGGLGAWVDSPSALPAGGYGGAAAVLNGYLYYMPGQYNGVSTGTGVVYYSSINGADGGLGTWQTTTALPQARSDFGLVAANGRVYVVGGVYLSSGSTCEPSRILVASQNNDGSLSDWSWVDTAFALDLRFANVGVVDGYLVVGGGVNHTDQQQTGNLKIVAAPLGSNGSLGNWQTVGSLPETANERASAFSDSALYFFGGNHIVGSTSATLLSATSRFEISVDGGSTCPAAGH